MDQVEEIKRKIGIADVVGEYVELKKAGRNFKGLCPFHGEKTPSFMVNEELSIFKCFGCGVSGDVIKFMMDIEGIGFVEALEKLAWRAGVKLVRRRGEDRSERMKLFDVCSLSGEYYHFLLTKHRVGKRARDYLKERGVGEKAISTFRLGYALDSWDGVYKFLCKKKGFDEGLVEKAGLIIKGRRGYYDRFRDRVIFPFYDNISRVVGFAGRVLPDYAGEGGKYINSPETPIYHKGNTLFGLVQAKQFIREKNKAVLVEGPMDMISSYIAGVGETVASNGTAVTEEIIKIIARLAGQIIIAMDTDEAGYAAIKKTVGLAEEAGLGIKVVKIERGSDPDEMARSNPKAWKRAVAKAVPIYEFVMGKALERFGRKDTEAIGKVSQEVLPFLVKIENKMILGHWVKKLAGELDLDEKRVWEELERYRRVGKVKIGEENKTKKEKKDRLRELGERLISLLFGASGQEKQEVKKKLAGLRLGSPWAGAIKSAVEAEGKVEEVIRRAGEKEAEVLREACLSDMDRSGLRAVDLAAEFRREWIARRRKELVAEIKKLEKAGKKEKMKQGLEEFMGLG